MNIVALVLAGLAVYFFAVKNNQNANNSRHTDIGLALLTIAWCVQLIFPVWQLIAHVGRAR